MIIPPNPSQNTDSTKRFAAGFKAGQLSVNRRNKSGCCCIIDDNDQVISACGAHLNWRDIPKEYTMTSKDDGLMSDSLNVFIKLAEDHYWDTVESDRDIILKHIYAIALMVTKKKFNDYSENMIAKETP